MNQKFYKILPKSLNCNDFQYQEGLNIDTKPINSEECSYGLHFTDAAHIMDFIGYGSMIADVEVPEDAVVYHFEEKAKADRIILKNIRPLYNVDTFKALVEDGANLHIEDNLIMRSFEIYSKADVIEYLIQQGIDVCSCDNLMIRTASYLGCFDTVKLLLAHGADIHADNGRAVISTIRMGYFDIFQYLIEIESVLWTTEELDLFLSHALELGRMEMVEHLIKHGADIKRFSKSLFSMTLSYAAMQWNVQTVEFMLENYPYYDSRDLEYTLTGVLECRKGDAEVVKVLIKKGAPARFNDNSLIINAVRHDNLELVKLLVEYGADPHARNGWALRYARRHNNQEMIDYLLAVK